MKKQHTFLIVLLMISITSCIEKRPASHIEWQIATSLPDPNGVAGPVTGISNGLLIVGGGANFPEALPWEGGKKVYHHTAYLFSINSGKLILLEEDCQLPDTVAYAACAQTPEGIVYAGGENANGPVANVYHLQVNNGKLVTKRLPDLPVAITNATMNFYRNYLYFTGGETHLETSGKAWKLSLLDTSIGWQPLPSLPHPVSHGVQLLLHENEKGMLYLIGGRAKNPNGISTLHTTVHAFDLTDERWISRPSLPYALAAGTGITLHNKAYLFGGDKGTIFTQVETLLAEAAQQSGAGRDSLINRKNQLQNQHAGFSTSVLCYTPQLSEWNNTGNIPFTVPVTTTALRNDDHIFIISGEIRPGIRTPDIISGTITTPNR